MKLKHPVLLAGLLVALGSSSAFANDRETLSVGAQAPDSAQVEAFLFPEAECENAQYQCLAVRPSAERSIGMELRFRTGSSELTPEAKAQLVGLGKALEARKGKLKAGEIVIEGHADARGSAELNKKLSEERARAVVKHLVATHSVDGSALKPVGVGKDRLKDASRPDAEINRRVELVRTAI